MNSDAGIAIIGLESQEAKLKDYFYNLQADCWRISEDHGFHEDYEKGKIGEKIALIHSEVSEALEYSRKEGEEVMDDHLTHRLGIEVELADAIIRILDLAHLEGLDVGAAVIEKCRYNMSRPYKHGKKF